MGLLPSLAMGVVEAGLVCGLPSAMAYFSRNAIAENIRRTGDLTGVYNLYQLSPVLGTGYLSIPGGFLFSAYGGAVHGAFTPLYRARSAAWVSEHYDKAASLYLETLKGAKGLRGRAAKTAKTVFLNQEMLGRVVDYQYSQLASALDAGLLQNMIVDRESKASLLRIIAGSKGEERAEIIRHLRNVCAFGTIEECRQAVTLAKEAGSATEYLRDLEDISRKVTRRYRDLMVELYRAETYRNQLREIEKANKAEAREVRSLITDYEKTVKDLEEAHRELEEATKRYASLAFKLERELPTAAGGKRIISVRWRGTETSDIASFLASLRETDNFDQITLRIETYGGYEEVPLSRIMKKNKEIGKMIYDLIKSKEQIKTYEEKVRLIEERLKQLDRLVRGRLADLGVDVEPIRSSTAEFKNGIGEEVEEGKVRTVDDLVGAAEKLEEKEGIDKKALRAVIDLMKDKYGALRRTLGDYLGKVAEVFRKADKFIKQAYKEKGTARQILESMACAGAGYLGGTIVTSLRYPIPSHIPEALNLTIGNDCLIAQGVEIGWCSGK